MSNPWRTAFFVPLSFAFLWLIALCFAPLFTSISFAQAGSKTLIGALNFLLVWGWWFLLVPPVFVCTWLLGKWWTDQAIAESRQRQKAEEDRAREIRLQSEQDIKNHKAKAEADAKADAEYTLAKARMQLEAREKETEAREFAVAERENKIKTYLAEKDTAEKTAAKWKGWYEARTTQLTQAITALGETPPNVGFALKIMTRKQRSRKRS